MNLKILFQRNLHFGKKLIQLHHYNAILFFLLSMTGLLLFSSAFRSTFPSIRVLMKDLHIWIGVIICIPLLVYIPEMKKHVKTLSKKKNNRVNLRFILSILILLIISGFLLTFHRVTPPIVSSWALLIHDVATWIGLPYVIYHSMTRSKWFKKLEMRINKVEIKEEPMLIEDGNPIYKRRTFLRSLSGSIIVSMFLPVIARWFQPNFVSYSEKSSGLNRNQFSPIPSPNAKSVPPIGGGRKGEFRYYTITEIPKLNDENWSFTIDGLVEKKSTYKWNQFVHLERDVQVSDFHCVTGWSVYSVTWEGIPLRTLLKQAGIKKEAKYVKFYSADGVYTSTLSLDHAMIDDVMVAVLIDGEQITEKNGGPVRLIVPKMYAYKSVKWLNRIELIDYEHIGYWEKRGYSQDAWVN
ncbi:molybdopterin-dependent oxidoreductase-like protein [Cytobacillus firmus]|uniref:Molybdopterin-dependent oxidoreductase-like protein n=3 Tax=Cytobacillus TaxID=2675230 RepID=A0A366JAC7_CYTFI|nr:molybdopterin-dependent oxidoreductase [Cytobacillus firmus]RBP83986.1 molybdopterin-dependent oxidoreductase-like protein [Cytobacillus firmus]